MKNFFYLNLLLPLLLCGAAPAPLITTSIEEGQDIVAGDIVVFDASGTLDATGFKWAVLPAKFADNRPTHEVSNDGKSLRLASRPGSYLILLAVTNVESEISIVKRDVIVGGVLPGPVPGPTPGPRPLPTPPVTPKFPDEEMGVSTIAYNAALTLPDKTKLKSLALAFKQIGGAAVAGGFEAATDVKTASRDANQKAICGDLDPKSPEGAALLNKYLPFFVAIQPKLKELSNGPAADAKGYGKALIEIGVGLDAVK